MGSIPIIPILILKLTHKYYHTNYYLLIKIII